MVKWCVIEKPVDFGLTKSREAKGTEPRDTRAESRVLTPFDGNGVASLGAGLRWAKFDEVGQ